MEGVKTLSLLCSSAVVVLLSFLLFLYHRPEKMALSPGDPNSFARPDQARVTHIHLDLDVDFDRKVLTGATILTVERVAPDIDHVILDVNKLDIHGILDEASGQTLEYTYGEALDWGAKLDIKLPADAAKEVKLRVNYTTSPNSSALQGRIFFQS